MNKTKKIAFDARFYGEAGPGRYTKNILEQLEQIDQTNQYLVFLKKDQFNEFELKSSNFTKIEANYPWYSFSEQIFFLFKLLKYNPDLLYVPHFNIPVLFPKIIITAIPDIIMHSFSTEKGTTLPRPYFKLKKVVYKLVTRWAIFRSSVVVVPSQATLNDISTVFGAPKSKLVYAPEGVDPQINKQNVENEVGTLASMSIQKPYILYVGSMYEHKNLDKLVEAFAELVKKPDFSLNLVLAGKNDKFSQRIEALIKDKDLNNRVFMPGQMRRVSDSQMNTLRAGCEFYVFPSLKEGFSLTPMEAMVFNKACVISDIDCHREIYKDSVLYFDPNKINDISSRIYEMSKSAELKRDLIEKSQVILNKYNWKNTAEITLRVFNTVLNNI